VNYNKEMSRLVNLNSVDDKILDEILKDDIIIYEDVHKTEVYFKRTYQHG